MVNEISEIPSNSCEGCIFLHNVYKEYSMCIHQVKQRKIKCGKCGSFNIASPTNVELVDWVFLCLDCKHEQKQEKDPKDIDPYFWCCAEEDFDKPIEF